ncbi:MAG: ATP-binding cassette domain-containing protein, partial [Coriobacteriales bacterium]|nr:ATP-binding cassette domain-containing protein [Coriobacteriales bacterium]
CDKVYVFEAGRVVQTGTHEELAKQDGPYASLWARQAELEDFSARSGESADKQAGEQACQAADDAPSQQAITRTGAATPKRGKVRVILELVKLTRPLLGVLACAVVLGVAGFLAAIGITVLATSALLDLEGQACWVAASVATVAAVACGIARGPLRYAEQLCNHYLAFRVLALVRDKVFAAMRRLAPAKLEGKEKGDLVSLVTADIELLEVFYAHTLSPAAIALTVSIIVLIFLFATTIRENLLVAKADASDEELIAALEKAALRELVERLPQGLDTQLAELGDSLSGGERQRLGLARVFLQDAPLLLLDEPTSNLDALSEASILKALQENRADKTVVIVTHRASAGAIVDDTYALSNGTLLG